MDQGAWRRVQSTGIRSASAVDLLAMMLTRQSEDIDANQPAAQSILKRFSLSRLSDLAPLDLFEASGLEDFEAHRILAAMELGRRSATSGVGLSHEIEGPESAFAHFRDLKDAREERFEALFLTAKNGVIARQTIHIGTLTMSVVGPRELFREAVRNNAAAVIVAHNHPSGDPTPSPEDLQITRKLREIGELLDIPLHDHLIIGRNEKEGSGWVSLAKLGKI